MTLVSIGDMTRSFQLRSQFAQTKTDLSIFTKELSSGQHSDMGKALKGDFSALSDIRRGLRMNEAYRSAAAEAALIASTAQSALDAVQSNLDETAPALLAAVGAGTLQHMEIVAASAPDRLQSMISSINQEAAGRAIFSGTATDTRPLISLDDLMAILGPIADAAVNSADLIATLDAWFLGSGGGFELAAYQGTTGTPPSFNVAEGQSISNPLSALDDGIKTALMGMAMASLVAEGRGPSTAEDKAAILEKSALSMMSGNEGVTRLRADLGHVEARLEEASIRNQAAKSVLELEYNRLTGVDPYEAATKLQETQTRLESLYLLTTRLSQLSLTEYLR